MPRTDYKIAKRVTFPKDLQDREVVSPLANDNIPQRIANSPTKCALVSYAMRALTDFKLRKQVIPLQAKIARILINNKMDGQLLRRYEELDTFVRLRKRVGELQENPRILAIELRSFRHWGGTMLAWKSNGNVLLVKNLLGHKNIRNTMRYIGKIHFKDNDFETTAATTLEEILLLGKTGWIKYDEIAVGGTVVHVYRKPKKFQGITI